MTVDAYGFPIPGAHNAVPVVRRLKSDELPENVERIPGHEWQFIVFARRPVAAVVYSFIGLIPALIGAWFAYSLFWQSLAIVPWFVAPVFFFVYWRLDKTSTRIAFVIRSNPSTGFMIDRQQWWKWDHWRYPEQSKFEIRNAKRKLLFPYRVPWIDARGEFAKVFDPHSIPIVFDLIDTHKPDEIVTSASIIGVESYNKSTYLLARATPNADFLMRNVPWLIVLGGCFLGVFLGAGRIAEIVGIR